MLVVTHDLGLAWNIADRIAVMYLGRIVEAGPTEEVLARPAAPLHPGPAVRRARDRADRAGRAHRRDARPDADPARLPVPPALPGAGRRRGRRRPASPATAGRTPLPIVPAGGGPPRGLSPGRRTRGEPRMTEPSEPGCRPRCPARCTSTPSAWRARARAGAVRDVVLRRPASTTSGSTDPGRVAVVDVVGESVLVTRDDDGAARGVQRLPAPRLAAGPARARRSEPVCAAAGALRCPYHSWTYSLAGRLLGAAHRRRRGRPGDFSLHPVGVEEWAGFVFVNLDARPSTRRALRRRRRRGPRPTWRNYAMGELVTGLTLTYDVAAN